jgi:sialate O-acetylesterase
MNRILSLLVLASVASVFTPSTSIYAQQEQLRLANIFSDHMVLQRDEPIPVWGWAKPGENVKVSMAEHTGEATADANGKWMVKLDPLPASGPHEMQVQGSRELSVSDVLVGEVWLCSGQSNMAWTVKQAKDFDKEVKLADFPQIRMMTVARNSIGTVAQDCKGQWKVASSETVGQFSASAWFFGRKLHKELGVPVGLINSSWGGTDVAAWTSRDVQLANETLANQIKAWDDRGNKFDAAKANANYAKALKTWEARKAEGKKVGRKPRLQADPAKNQNRPANLFNGMINPLVPYGMRGAIWYQGERNAKSIENGKLYATQLKMMINDWRGRWGIGDFPFITVQLPNFHKPTDAPVQNTGWVMVRESQAKSLELKNTGLAVTTDVGMANNIHPTNKQAVGKRLALWALGTTYGKDMVYSGPMFRAAQIESNSAEGNGRITIVLDHVGEGLMTNDGSKELTGFAVAGRDQVFHSAKAIFDDENGTLQVSSDNVPQPVAARYNWADNPSGNVVNSASLPMAPFRTDNWKVVGTKK